MKKHCFVQTTFVGQPVNRGEREAKITSLLYNAQIGVVVQSIDLLEGFSLFVRSMPLWGLEHRYTDWLGLPLISDYDTRLSVYRCLSVGVSLSLPMSVFVFCVLLDHRILFLLAKHQRMTEKTK